MYRFQDQTDTNTHTAVTSKMFGTNLMITDQNFLSSTQNLTEDIRNLGVTNLRYPGGSVTEKYFDISDVAHGSYDKVSGSFQDGAPNQLIPFSDFMQGAANLGASVTIVLPTIDGFAETAGQALLDGAYGERVVDAAYLDSIAQFVTAATQMANNLRVEIDSFEIGNEYWGSGEMTAKEYGALASAVTVTAQDTLEHEGVASADQPAIIVQTPTAAGLFSPKGSSTVYVDDQTGYVYTHGEVSKNPALDFHNLVEVQVSGQGSAKSQNMDIISAFDQQNIQVANADGSLTTFDVSQAVNAIDGVANHYYARHGFSDVDTNHQFGFNQLETWQTVFANRNSSLADLQFYVSEWNVDKDPDVNVANNRGMQQAAMDIEIFYEMTTHGVVAADFWPLSFNMTQSTTLVEHGGSGLSLAGETFRMMSESLVGLTPSLDFSVSGNFDIHGFSDASRSVFFISERSGTDQTVTLDFGGVLDPGASSYFVTLQELSDGGAGGQDEKAIPVLFNADGQTVNVDAFNAYAVSLDADSIVRLELTSVYTSAPNLIQGREGNDQIVGGNVGDRLSGGEGNDWIQGLDGNDRLSGGAGNDILTGGAQADVFVFTNGYGNDTIVDFNANSDLEHIDFSTLSGMDNFADVSAAAAQIGADVLIDTGRGSVLLQDVNLHALDAADFIF